MTNKRSRIHRKHWKNSLSNRALQSIRMFTTETRVSISALPLETRDNGETQFSRFFKSRQVPEQYLICGPLEKIQHKQTKVNSAMAIL